MTLSKGKQNGILGTIIIHLVAGIIFMSLQLNSLQKKIARQYEVELAPAELLTKKEEPKPDPKISVEKVLKGDEEMLNIAKNLANKPSEKISKADYIDQVKNELIKSGKLGSDNFIDDQKKASQSSGTEGISTQKDTVSVKKQSDPKPEKSQDMAANFKGATRIYYELVGRNHVYLPIPIYKCQGSGKVVLSIEVDQRGNVQRAQLAERESTAIDPCLVETAISTAMISRFNPDASAPRVQVGMLTYHFVAQ
jgi:hypothetical protein